jgi:Putative bacterial sensory transduction regulator
LSERAPLGDAESARRLDATVSSWAKEWRASALLGVEHQALADDRGHFHWLIRLKGEEKDVITLWLSLRQRTVHVETEVTPAPEENRETLYRYLLTKNAELRELHLAIGPEDGIYLMAQIPIVEMTTERLDEVVGATLIYVEEIYPTAMTMGLPSLYRRRRKT